jgi:hypothetical protein
MTNPSLASTLRAVVEARKAATPGPWRVDDDWFIVSVPAEVDDESGMETFDPRIDIAARGHNYPDAALIEAAANWVESYGEAAAAALERAQAALTEALDLVAGPGNGTWHRSRPIEEWQRLFRLFDEARTALEGRST